MGYNTSFELTPQPGDLIENHIGDLPYKDAVKEKVRMLGVLALCELEEGWCGEDSWKWYEHEDDMCVVSDLFPGTLFVLKGEGEDPGDIWEKHFQDGKMVRKYVGKITMVETNV